MPKLSLALAVALPLALAGCGGLSVLPETPVENATHTAVLDEVAAAAAISAYRVQHGLSPVVVDSALVKAAAFQAGNNARHGQLSHDVGGSFTSRMASAVSPSERVFMMTVVGAQWIVVRPPAASKAGTTWASKAPRTTSAHFRRVSGRSFAMMGLVFRLWNWAPRRSAGSRRLGWPALGRRCAAASG
ncbi:hypothetical protein OMR07_08245 [Methylobacterium organophilum]|nr:hypothetical protein [Methylobacterium organophilum]